MKKRVIILDTNDLLNDPETPKVEKNERQS